ncbi:hypothetical protein [Streptomyces griseosporeus]|uniref:hypothetical protein n=1 Tax=Streptomyces griseosporeus TaxID=1910 RepID=UPI0037008644
MASGPTALTVHCPHCEEPIEVPVTARHLSRTEVAISVDLGSAREHIAVHVPRLITDLPPTAR